MKSKPTLIIGWGIVILILLATSNEVSADHTKGSIQLNGVTLKQLEPGVTNPKILEGTKQKFLVEVEANEGEELESIRIYPWFWVGDVLKDYPAKICRAFLGGDKTCKHSVTAEIVPHAWGNTIGEPLHGISRWYAEITTKSGKKSKVVWEIEVVEDERLLGNGSFSLTPADSEINVKVGESQEFTAHWTNSQVYIILFTAEGAVSDSKLSTLEGIPAGFAASDNYALSPGFAVSEMKHSFRCKWNKPGKYTVKVYAILSHIGSLTNLSIADPTAKNPEKWTVNVESNESDLIIESVEAEPSTVAPGAEFKLWATLKNKGPGTSSATTVRYYQQSKVLGFTRDTEIGKGKRDPLPVDETIREHYVVTAPTEPGTYEYRVCVDKVPKETDTRNNCSEIVTVTVGSDPVIEPISIADIALIIDSSGSMSGSDPNNLRISAANFFIDLSGPTVQIAIIDFDDSARTLAPLTFANPTGKTDLKSAVNRVGVGGGTNIGRGLQKAFQELIASKSNAKKVAVLLTDGEGSYTQQGVLDYANRGWSIYTIGLGSGVNRNTLQTISAATPEGEYFPVDLNNIQTVYNKIFAKTTGKSVLASHNGFINQDQQITKKVTIDDTLEKVDYAINWQGSTIELVLIDPNGVQITPDVAAANSRITYQATPTFAIYTVENPTAGEWQMQATGTNIPAGGESFNLTVSATSDFFTNLLPFDASYTIGDTIRIGIRAQEKTGDTFSPVLGATTSAKIIRPDGKIDTLNLFDDGSHSDGAANDGVYANNYRSVDKQGTYLLKVSAENGFSREIQEQVVVGRIDNVFIDGATLTPAAGTTLDQTPNVISAVISGPAGKINSNSIVLIVDGNTVSHTYDSVNQLVSYRPSGLSGGSHSVQLSIQDTNGRTIETTWRFTKKVVDVLPPQTPGHYTTWGLPEGSKVRLGKGSIFDVKYSPGGRMLAVASSIGIWIYDSQTLQELALLTGHTSSVRSVAFSPDSTILASGGSQDGTIRLWDVNTGTQIKKITGHEYRVNTVAFSPDGTTLASGSSDNVTRSSDDTIRLWDVNTGTQIKKITGHTENVVSVVFSPDGTTLASGSWDGTIRLWDVNTGTELKKIAGHTGSVSSVAFSPDGQTIASGSWDDTIHLWDVNTGNEIKKITGHTSGVHSVAFSPDGQTIASGGWNDTIRLWDVKTGTELKKITGHTSSVNSVVFSPDGQTIASGSGDRTIRLWDINTGTELKKITGHTSSVLSVVFSPDGQTIASASWDKTIRLWDVNTDREIKKLTGHTWEVDTVAFSPDGQTIASGSGDRTIRLWDVNTGTELKKITGHTGPVNSVVFSPDGQTIASGGWDDTIRLWDVNTGREIKKITGHTSSVLSVVFSPDGQTIASASWDKTIRLWDVNTDREIKKITGHTSAVWSVAFSPDGQTLASGSDDRTIRLWGINTGSEIKKFTGYRYRANSVVFSPDGQTIASGSRYDTIAGIDDTFWLWDVNTGTEIKKTGHTGNVRSVVFSPDGQTIASGSSDGTILLWDVGYFKSVNARERQLKRIAGHTWGVSSVVFSPDGQTIASGSWDKTIRLWNTTTGREIKKLTGHTSSVLSVAFSPDGQTIASGSWDKTIRLWNTTTGREIKKLTGHTSSVLSVAFSPDGQTIASGSGVWDGDDNTIRLWNVNTATQIKKLTGHTWGVSSVVFSPDGQTIASGSWDKTIRLWNTTTGREIKKLTGHTSSVLSVAFSPDGQTIASGSGVWDGDDNTIRLWDTTTGREIKKLTGHTGSVSSVVYSPDGQTIASGSDDETIRLWDVTPQPVVQEDIAHIYWTDRDTDKVQRANMDGSNIKDLITTGLDTPQGIAVDVANGKVYWTDSATKKIQRANLDGSDVEDLVTGLLGNPDGIALDVADDKMYWTDWLTNKIQLANLDGSGVQDLITTGLSGPTGIALDVAGGKMYWTEWIGNTIQRANLDGTGVQELVTGLSLPIDIALDVAGDKMYWTEWAAAKVRCANLDGSNIKDLVTDADGLSEPQGIALDISDGKMYWTDRKTDKIQCANLDGTGVQDLVTGLSEPRGIALGIPIDTPPVVQVVREDVNGDGVVDLQDTAVVTKNLGKTGENAADVNRDGVVDVEDLVLVLAAIEAAAGAPARHTQVSHLFTAEEVQQWLVEARQFANKSPAHRRGILVLEQLLALLKPKETALLPNYPNPFNPETWVPYQLANDADVTLHIYAVKGTLVRTLTLGRKAAGMYQIRSRAAYWDGRNALGEKVASGVYFYTLKAGNFTATRKMLIRK